MIAAIIQIYPNTDQWGTGSVDGPEFTAILSVGHVGTSGQTLDIALSVVLEKTSVRRY